MVYVTEKCGDPFIAMIKMNPFCDRELAANAHVNVDGSSRQWKDGCNCNVIGDFVSSVVFGDPVCCLKGGIAWKVSHVMISVNLLNYEYWIIGDRRFLVSRKCTKNMGDLITQWRSSMVKAFLNYDNMHRNTWSMIMQKC